jgi:protein gp37
VPQGLSKTNGEEMNKTSIEWVKNPDGTQGYTWNPITGCLNGCPYCYARKLANGRLKQRYLSMPKTIYDNVGITVQNYGKLPKNYTFDPDPFAPRFWGQRLEDKDIWQRIDGQAKPKGIFVCDMGELFGDWLPEQWQLEVFEVIRKCRRHRFYLLTKQPQNLIKFSPFPDNCWVGVTATDFKAFAYATLYLGQIEAKIKYISFEPLLERIGTDRKGGYGSEFLADDIKHFLNWLIIGAQTKPYKPPNSLWVHEIIVAAREAGIPYFLKDNLKPILPVEAPYYWMPGTLLHDKDNMYYEIDKPVLRQEMPSA